MRQNQSDAELLLLLLNDKLQINSRPPLFLSQLTLTSLFSFFSLITRPIFRLLVSHSYSIFAKRCVCRFCLSNQMLLIKCPCGYRNCSDFLLSLAFERSFPLTYTQRDDPVSCQSPISPIASGGFFLTNSSRIIKNLNFIINLVLCQNAVCFQFTSNIQV